MLRAFSLLSDVVPDASLYLIGDGPDRSSFEALARELGVVERTHFMGFVLDPRAYLAGADVFVLASHKEAGGLVLSEAREAGCAIVATRVDGNPEMLDGGEAGLLVPPSSPGALANAIKLLLTNPRARAALVARTSLNLEAFHVQRVCDAYLSIYRIGLDAVNPQQAATGARPAASREIPTKNVRMESHGFARNHDVMVGDQAVEDPDVRGFAVCVTTMNRVESLAACIKNLVRCVPRAACIFVSDDSTEAETRAANQTFAAQH
ncbi:MAG: hypothetical protein QOI13_3572, partial [Paraburkholderia sp.]|nr:hypothetical protein [Paraburkholderia sp.]